MLIYIDTKKDGTVISWGYEPMTSASIPVEIDNDHPFKNEAPKTYKYANGLLVKDEEAVIIRKAAKKDAIEGKKQFKSRDFKTLSTPEKDALLERMARELGYL